MYLLYMNPVLIASAAIPAIALLIYVYRQDKLEKEPRGLLISLVLYGIVATFFAMVAETVGEWLIEAYEFDDPNTAAVIMYFIVVGLSEEGFKYILLYRRTWRSPSFNCQFDGIVYAVSVSLGFALWENIGYVAQYGFSTAVLRAVTAVPGHACFGVFMGTWYGIAKRLSFRDSGLSKLCRCLSLVFPVLLHGAYDYIASMEDSDSTELFIGFVIIMFFAAFLTVRRMSKNDRYI